MKDVARVGTGPLPEPARLQVADILPGSFNARLVKVAGQLHVPPNFLATRAEAILEDATGKIEVFAAGYLFDAPAFLERFKQGGTVEIVAIPIIVDGPDGLHVRLIPRDAADFKFTPLPPVRALAIGTAFVLLVSWGWITVLRRQRADRRANELAERARKATDERDHFFALSLDMLCIAGADGYFKRLNPAFSRTLGWPTEALLARPLLEFVHPDDRVVMARELDGASPTGDHDGFDARFRCADGSWCVLSWKAVKLPEGAIYATARDATAQRHLESTLRTLNRELEQRVNARTAEVQQALATLDATEDGAFIFDPTTLRFSYVNAGACRQVGYDREELLAATPVLVMSEFTEEQIRSLLAPMAAGAPLARSLTTVHRHKDGHDVPVEINLQYVAPAGEPPRFVSIVRDITERRKSERLAFRSQRLESLGTLAGGVAHDLNNALTPLTMGLDVLRAKCPGETQLIDTFRTSVKRGADMVRQLLTFARGAEGRHQHIQPGRVFAELEQIVQFTFPKNIQLDFRCEEALPSVRGDTTQIHQVLLNLCVNARDAMPDGGVLTIAAHVAEIDSTAAATFVDARPGRYVVFRVSDTGTGIPPDVLDRIFDPFFTTKPPDQGTGLGLSTVIGIMKGHAGFLQVYSVVGRGSSFSAYFPVDDAAPALIGSNTPFELLGSEEKILLVDDEPSVREIGVIVLRRMNLDPVLATDGADALRQLAKHRDSLRAIVTDLHMPKMDGPAFLAAARKLLPRIPIITTSGRMEEKDREASRKAGTFAHLEKPFTARQLADVLRPLLAKGEIRRAGRQVAPPDAPHLRQPGD